MDDLVDVSRLDAAAETTMINHPGHGRETG